MVVGGVWLLVQSLPANAEIYMHRDEDGTVHFSNVPDKRDYKRFVSGSFPRSWSHRRFSPPRGGGPFEAIIRASARRHRVEPALIKAVIRAESNFVPDARSPKGALGLMQLMPGTARMHNVSRVFDPVENIEGGVRHLRLLLDQYHGNVKLALAAYNARSEAVARHGGIPPYRETREYLGRVLRYRRHYRQQP